MPRAMSAARSYVIVLSSLLAASPHLAAQGTIRGVVTEADQRPVPDAIVHLSGTTLGARSDSSGLFRVLRVPAGSYTIRVAKLGFGPESTTVVVQNGATVTQTFALHALVTELTSITITSQRLGETEAAALQRQADAPNIVKVLPGDVIRALPNANAAEAAGRMPGVTTERDEGEGKFIQIRGTAPELNNLTINGAHVPGSQGGSRTVKLDVIPSDLLAGIEVSKTLTADMDADAIGGSVNLVTKTPEGPPEGYVAAQYGAVTLRNKNQLQGGFALSGRFGPDRRLGILLGGSADRNNRTTNDLEPAWSKDGSGRPIPIEWSQRDYQFARNRYGLGGDIDYRFANGSAIALKGLFSRFEDYGVTYVKDLAVTGDSAGSGAQGFGTGGELTRQSYNRTPLQQLFGSTLSGRTHLGVFEVRADLNAAVTDEKLNDYRFHPFVFDGLDGNGITVAYDASNTKIPTYHIVDPATAAAGEDPANFGESHYFTIDNRTHGRDLGGALNLQTPWHSGGQNWSASLQFGAKYRDESKTHSRLGGFWFDTTGTPIPLVGNLSSFSDPHYYQYASNAFSMGLTPDQAKAHASENAAGFVNGTDPVGNQLGTFNGSERITAGYVANTVTWSKLELYTGLRVEHTSASYVGHVAVGDTSTGVTTVPGSQSYTDLFPSVQAKYSFDPQTHLRLAFTRAIARPDYQSLAPSLTGSPGGSQSDPSNVTSGNPSLKPQHAWNYDVMLEHFFTSVGVISGGVFYKQISDFIFNRTFTYTGPVTELDGFLGTRPENGGSGHILGFEADWAQRLVFLPGAWAGLGFDANYTHTSSRAVVAESGDGAAQRDAPLQRQSPNLANIALTYDLGRVSARAAWAYQGANIVSYGDGTPTPSGDTYFYAHSQFDASVIVDATSRIQFQLQVLNINNAVFGFFTGTTSHDYAIQREYYGRTFYFGTKYKF
ncbi:MAG: TonB-dependent receptor [Gemmatimonadaceae bacterium]